MAGIECVLQKGRIAAPNSGGVIQRTARILEEDAGGREGYPHIPFVFNLGLAKCGVVSDPTVVYPAATPVGNYGSFGASGRGLGTPLSLHMLTPGTLSYIGGGIDFGNVATREGAMVVSPAGALAGIGEHQYFQVWSWWRTPAEEDWPSSANPYPILATNDDTDVGGQPSLIFAGMVTSGGSKALVSLRQTGVSNGQLGILMEGGDYASIALQMFARWPGGSRLGFWTPANGLRVATGSVGSDNTNTVSDLRLRWGISKPYWPADLTGISARHWRLYGGGIELGYETSGRNPDEGMATIIESGQEALAAGIWVP